MGNFQPKLSIVGAGPGDLDLITLRGIQALRNAGVVFYDDPRFENLLLEYAGAAVRIFVGRRRRQSPLSEEDILELTVQYAETYGHVVRLRSGGTQSSLQDAQALQYALYRGLQAEYIPDVAPVPDSFAFLNQTAA
jgi:uroporphyrin-III C-methyltransferase